MPELSEAGKNFKIILEEKLERNLKEDEWIIKTCRRR